MKYRRKKLASYVHALPDILTYQLLTKPLIGLWLFLMGRLFRLLLNSMGRVAVSTGDFAFLFTDWRGILIILCAFISLYVYFAFDLNAKILLSRDLLSGRKIIVRDILKKAFLSLKAFAGLRGIGVIMYIALIAPVLGVGLSLTMTKGFYIPTFISSVIADTPLYLAAASVLIVVFVSAGVANLFILHGTVLDGLSVRDAGVQSRRMVRENWKDYLRQNLLFFLSAATLLAAVVTAVLVLPLALTQLLTLPAGARRYLTVFFVTSGVLLSLLTGLFATPLYLMKMTQLYGQYGQADATPLHRQVNRRLLFPVLAVVLWIALTSAASAVMTGRFDALFPQESRVQIIAHRGGGTEGPENTVAGIEKAWEIGAYGSEIDIQRTADGHYVLNHDANFLRVAGESRNPEELTLEEIKTLSVEGEPVPTLDEALSASGGKGILFIELKGQTADLQMADDAVKAIREHGMERECVLISLKYGLIDYIESTYPEIQTGYLTFASFGDTVLLNCDYLALEEESATEDVIFAAHSQGKKVLVWTVNDSRSQRHFLCSTADGIITDNILQAAELLEELKGRSDLQRMTDRIIQILS